MKKNTISILASVFLLALVLSACSTGSGEPDLRIVEYRSYVDKDLYILRIWEPVEEARARAVITPKAGDVFELIVMYDGKGPEVKISAGSIEIIPSTGEGIIIQLTDINGTSLQAIVAIVITETPSGSGTEVKEVSILVSITGEVKKGNNEPSTSLNGTEDKVTPLTGLDDKGNSVTVTRDKSAPGTPKDAAEIKEKKPSPTPANNNQGGGSVGGGGSGGSGGGSGSSGGSGGSGSGGSGGSGGTGGGGGGTGGNTTVAVNSVTLNKPTLTLPQGASETLTATVNPSNATNKNVTWVSDDTDVATVNASGVVTAANTGTATITVTTVSGSKTAECEVTVTPPGPTDINEIPLAQPHLLAAPQMSIETTQYTGVVSWSPAVAAGGTFAASTIYTATIALTAKPGYTLGVAANFFSVEHATSVTFNAGTSEVTVVFPVTAATPSGEVTMAYYWVNQEDALVFSPNTVSVSRAVSTAARTISAAGTGYTNQTWYLKGVQAGTGNSYNFNPAGMPNGQYILTLVVQKNSKYYSANITVTVND